MSCDMQGFTTQNDLSSLYFELIRISKEDYDELAASLLKTFKRVVSDWATFDDESYSYLKEIES